MGSDLPRIGTPRRDRPTLGPHVAEIATQLGMVLHPWQRHRADVCGELVARDDGDGLRLAAGTTLTLAGRQTGKTTAVTADVAFRCLAPDLGDVVELVGRRIGPQHVAFTAQDRIAALGRWYEHVDRIMASDLAGHVAKVVRKNGEECVHWRNGSKYRIVTPSKTGARGLSLDMCVIDEALTHQGWLLEVVAPTMAQRDSARVSFGAQLVVVSNAGDESATMLNELREVGRRSVVEGDDGRVLLEWSCPDDADVLDPAVWAATIPTLDEPDGITTAFLSRQAETMGVDAFAREYLCRTVLSVRAQVIDPAVWEDLPHVEISAGPGVVLAVEVAPNRDFAVIIAARQMRDHVGVELVDDHPGVDWVAARVVELAARYNATVIVDRFSPAATLIPTLAATTTLVVFGSSEMCDAAANLVDAVACRRVGHTGDPRLVDAVVGLGRRARGDRWTFDRHNGRAAALIAAASAVWHLENRVLAPAIH